eukprot:95605-Hanusia_phi.AAC.4
MPSIPPLSLSAQPDEPASGVSRREASVCMDVAEDPKLRGLSVHSTTRTSSQTFTAIAPIAFISHMHLGRQISLTVCPAARPGARRGRGPGPGPDRAGVRSQQRIGEKNRKRHWRYSTQTQRGKSDISHARPVPRRGRPGQASTPGPGPGPPPRAPQLESCGHDH